MRTILVMASAVAALAAATPAAAQVAGPTSTPAAPPAKPGLARITGGGSAMYVQPLGDFARNVDGGGGVQGTLMMRVGTSSVLALRLDGGFLIYGYERVRANNPISGRVKLEATTSNNVAFAGIGPQLALPVGPIRPYVGGTVGYAYFFTESSLSGDNEVEGFGHTTNQGDGNMALAGRAGLYLPFTASRRPVMFDLGAQYHHIGEVTYLRQGSIVDNPDGSVTVHRLRGDANFLTYHLGVTVGF
jgi:hypothetical protein